MGLDNGMILHSKRAIDIPRELAMVTLDFDSNGEFPFSYNILYFRKCWNVRHKMCDVLGASYEYCGKSWLTIDEVKATWCTLNQMNSRHTWETDTLNTSIWTYKEIKPYLDQALLTLEWLIKFMRDNESRLNVDFMIEFYDSY